MIEQRRWWWLGVFVVSGFLVYMLSPILTPFVMAAVFAYLGDPLVDWLEEKRLPRSLGVTVVFVLFTVFGFLFLLMMIPMLKQQVELVANKTPLILSWAENDALPYLSAVIGVESELDFSHIKQSIGEQLKSNSGVVGTILSSLTSSGMAIFGWVGNLVLIPVVCFYLLRDWDLLVERVADLLPRRVEPVVALLAKECDEVLSAFVRGQLMVMFILGGVYAVGLWFAGLELALIVGMVAGLASIVPYLGFIIGIVLASVAGIVQFGDPQILVWVAIVFAVGQMLEGMILTPLLVGDKIGLHPVAVIFAVLAGGQLFGFIGVLMALPIAAIIMVMLRHGHDRYIKSLFYDDIEPECLQGQKEGMMNSDPSIDEQHKSVDSMSEQQEPTNQLNHSTKKTPTQSNAKKSKKKTKNKRIAKKQKVTEGSKGISKDISKDKKGG